MQVFACKYMGKHLLAQIILAKKITLPGDLFQGWWNNSSAPK
jgi:hypothetical protein